MGSELSTGSVEISIPDPVEVLLVTVSRRSAETAWRRTRGGGA